MNKPVDNLSMILSKIKELRTRKGLQHKDLAEMLEIKMNTYNLLENGRITLTVDRLYKIAEILEVNITVLLGIETVLDEKVKEENKKIYDDWIKQQELVDTLRYSVDNLRQNILWKIRDKFDLMISLYHKKKVDENELIEWLSLNKKDATELLNAAILSSSDKTWLKDKLSKIQD